MAVRRRRLCRLGVVGDADPGAPAGQAVFLAADQDQGRLALDSIESYAALTPAVGEQVDVKAFTVNGPRGITLEVMAADAPGAWVGVIVISGRARAVGGGAEVAEAG